MSIPLITYHLINLMGPLKGVRIIELAGIGPAPFCGMMLSDMGADVIRIDREGVDPPLGRNGALSRGRRSIIIDLKKADGIDLVLQLVEKSNALIEGFRPGVMERLGLGPDDCLARNPALVYGRMTGWGQDGPLSQTSGHDINYIALSGALHAIGTSKDGPVPPLNLVGDFGGGGMYLAFGLVCALLEARNSGQGQVVDAAMIDGASSLMAMIYGMKAENKWQDKRQTNFLDGGAHFYRCYMCADNKWIAIGAIEDKFYFLLLDKLGIQPETFTDKNDSNNWQHLHEKLAAIFLTKSRDEWQDLLAGTDACFAPVLDLEEAPRHPHNASRNTFVNIDGQWQPAPAPRFSRSAAETNYSAPKMGAHSIEILAECGYSDAEIASLQSNGTIN
jgi:alpha-methylacyl-CoA racemase